MTNCFCFFLLSEIKENAISKQTPVWQVYGIASIKISHHSSCSWGYILGKSNIVSPSVQFSSVQSLTCIRLPVTPWTAGCQVYLSITNSQSPPKLMSIKLVMPSNHLILCHPILLPSIFPSISVLPMSQFFASGGQTTGVSASTSVLPMKNQDWSPLGWTGWISLRSKGLSRAF